MRAPADEALAMKTEQLQVNLNQTSASVEQVSKAVVEVTGQLRTPFVVQGGQVFINYAMIDTAFIQNLVLGMTLRSSAVNEQGLPLLEINIPAGKLILRGSAADGSSEWGNTGLKFVHGNGVTAIDLGLGV